jgi:hypothetical protein
MMKRTLNKLKLSGSLDFSSVVDPDPGSGSVLDPYSIGPLEGKNDPQKKKKFII